MSEKFKRYVGYCGDYRPTCEWHTGKIRESARNLLEVLDKRPELKFIAEKYGTCNYEELYKALKWLSSEIYCRGGNCRAGDGWTDCPIRKCCVTKGVDFCFQCPEFPCKTLTEHELFGERCIKKFEEIRDEGLENWIKRNYG